MDSTAPPDANDVEEAMALFWNAMLELAGRLMQMQGQAYLFFALLY